MTSTDQKPKDSIEQKRLSQLIAAGYTLELILTHSKGAPKIAKNGSAIEVNQYFLYVKYNDTIRAVYTQRQEPRCFTNIERALDWGKRIGFSSVKLELDYGNYVLEG